MANANWSMSSYAFRSVNQIISVCKDTISIVEISDQTTMGSRPIYKAQPNHVIKRVFSFDDAPRLTLCSIDIPSASNSVLLLVDSETGVIA